MFPPSAWIPNGAQPLGICLSTKAFVFVIGWYFESNTWTRALWKSVA